MRPLVTVVLSDKIRSLKVIRTPLHRHNSSVRNSSNCSRRTFNNKSTARLQRVLAQVDQYMEYAKSLLGAQYLRLCGKFSRFWQSFTDTNRLRPGTTLAQSSTHLCSGGSGRHSDQEQYDGPKNPFARSKPVVSAPLRSCRTPHPSRPWSALGPWSTAAVPSWYEILVHPHKQMCSCYEMSQKMPSCNVQAQLKLDDNESKPLSDQVDET